MNRSHSIHTRSEFVFKYTLKDFDVFRLLPSVIKFDLKEEKKLLKILRPKIIILCTKHRFLNMESMREHKQKLLNDGRKLKLHTHTAEQQNDKNKKKQFSETRESTKENL